MTIRSLKMEVTEFYQLLCYRSIKNYLWPPNPPCATPLLLYLCFYVRCILVCFFVLNLYVCLYQILPKLCILYMYAACILYIIYIIHALKNMACSMFMSYIQANHSLDIPNFIHRDYHRCVAAHGCEIYSLFNLKLSWMLW